MTVSILDTPQRLALCVSTAGERWVTTFIGHPPKTVVKDGRAYTTIMTMDVRHRAWAARWLSEAHQNRAKSASGTHRNVRRIASP
jgi:hypothetical protein